MASIETLSEIDAPVVPNEEEQLQRDVDVQKWMAEAKGRPLAFFVAGSGEVGKSALINNLLGLDKNDENAAKEADGLTGIMTTAAVTKHVLRRYDIDMVAFDTPGFQDPNIDDAEIIAQLVQKTGGRVDVFLYCASLRKRVSLEERRICKLLTKAFSASIWEKAIFVLTLANDDKVRQQSADQYQNLISNFDKELRKCVRMAGGVSEETIAAIPVHPAGYTDEILPHNQVSERSWQDQLYTEIMSKADPKIIPALLQLRWGTDAWKYAEYVVKGGTAVLTGTGALIGTGAGLAAGIDAGVAAGTVVGGAIAGPRGAFVGLAVGTVGGLAAGAAGGAVGGVVGGLAGVTYATMGALATFATTAVLEPSYATVGAIWSDDFRTIIKAKYKLWKKGPIEEGEREEQEQEQGGCTLM